MPRQAAAVASVILILCAACAPTWQDNVRKGLSTAATGAEESIGAAETICEQVLQVCIAKHENPCAALQKCLAVRQHMVQVAIITQLTALAGYVAVDAAERTKAEQALKESLRLLELIRRAIEALR